MAAQNTEYDAQNTFRERYGQNGTKLSGKAALFWLVILFHLRLEIIPTGLIKGKSGFPEMFYFISYDVVIKRLSTSMNKLTNLSDRLILATFDRLN